jgi:(2R)-3-sulfolactate dehydrogenase (NADP+)
MSEWGTTDRHGDAHPQGRRATDARAGANDRPVAARPAGGPAPVTTPGPVMGPPLTTTVGEAEAFAVRLLASAGMPEPAATRTAWALVVAEMWTLASHGLLRLPYYLDRFAHGGTNPGAELRLVRDQATTALYDGDNGLGHWQLWHAAEVAAIKARAAGIAAVAVGNSGHCGVLGLYVLPIVQAGLVGLVFSNGPAVMPPWGGHAPLLSTSPIAAGIPLPEQPAIIDLATSAAARGAIAQRQRTGQPLEPGWAFDATGHPTLDPSTALAGMLAPLGGAKGYALAFMVEALTGGVIGPCLAPDVADPLDPRSAGRPQRIAHLVLAFGPSWLDLDGRGVDRMANLARRTVDAGGRVPGGRRRPVSSIQPDDTLTLAPATVRALADAAEMLGVPLPAAWQVGDREPGAGTT